MTRYFAGEETASQLGAAAARQALAAAGVSLREVDALVCTGGTMQQPIPCNAALLAAALGAEADGLMTFDVNSTCLGFLTGLEVVSAQLAAGSFRRALIVAAEVGSPGLDWTQPESCAIIGDGAAAVLAESAGLNPDDADDPETGGPAPSGILATSFQTWPAGAGLTAIRGGGSALPARNFTEEAAREFLFQMDGPGVFRMASRLLPGFVRNFLDKG